MRIERKPEAKIVIIEKKGGKIRKLYEIVHLESATKVKVIEIKLHGIQFRPGTS